MYRAMLEDGKEPPVIRDEGNAVRLTFLGSDFSVPFRAFVESRMRDGFMLSLEHLLVLNYIVRHGEIDVATAASICQQHDREIRESLRQLVVKGILDVRRKGSASVWLLTPSTASSLQGRGEEKVVPLTKFAALERDATSVFRSAALEGRGVKTSEVREKLGLDAEDSKYLLRKMREKNIIKSNGKGPKAEWMLVGD